MIQTARWAPDGVTREGTPGAGLRVAVAGASHWHLPRHAQYLREAGVSFVAVSDPDPAVAERWADELSCRAVADTSAIVAARPDLVLALGPVSSMSAQAVELADAGLPMLAEKPLGLRGDEVAAVARAVRARGTWLSVALVQRYDPLWSLLDTLRDAGQLGEVAHLHARIVNGPPQRYAAWGSGWMLDPRTAGGGALLNLGIHGVDTFLHLTGTAGTAGATGATGTSGAGMSSEDGAVQVAGAAIGSRAHKQAIEDFGAVVLRTTSGIVGTVEAAYTYPDASAGMTRAGDNEVRLGTSSVYLIARDADVWQVTGQGEESRLGARAGDRYRDWAFDSLARFRAGQAPLAGIEDCLAAVHTLDEAYRAAGRPGQPPG